MWQYLQTEKSYKKKQKKAKIQEFMYGDMWNMEQEVYDYTGLNWSRRNGSKRFIEKNWRP
jgi:hypothetical protein